MSIDSLRRSFPGFPEFVYHIMADHRRGKTPEEISEAIGAEEIRKVIAESIRLVEANKATYGPGGSTVLPDPSPMELD